MKVLIPGGTGYLGGLLCQKLLEHSIAVTVPTRKKSTKPSIHEGYTALSFDDFFNPRQDLARDTFDSVVYLAGISSSTAFDNPFETFNVNAFTAANLMKNQLSNGCKHFIYASTSHVTDLLNGQISNDSLQGRSLSLYATSKLAAETLLTNENSDHEMQLELIRLNNCFGSPSKKFGSDTRGALNDFCRQAAENHEIVVKSVGTTRRTFTPATSVVNVLFDSLTQNKGIDASTEISDSSASLTLAEAAMLVIQVAEELLQQEIELVIAGEKISRSIITASPSSVQLPIPFVNEVVMTLRHYVGA